MTLRQDIEKLKLEAFDLESQVTEKQEELAVLRKGKTLQVKITEFEPHLQRGDRISVEEMRIYLKIVDKQREIKETIVQKDGEIRALETLIRQKKQEIIRLCSEIYGIQLCG